ncbi:MAG: leucine-rich repeat domain-containing protein [Acidobacteria bacterium]|nr:leucine-rich repeat domain-containing protein [Acidobacteriota bacterium]
MPKKTTRQTKPSASTATSALMAEAERRIAEAVKQKTTELNLAGLKLTKVPAALGSLRHLRGLYLNSNHLQKVPNELRGFRHLEALDLSVNLLREIPTWLGELRQLQHLVLSGNPIGKIPGSLGKLQELRTLYLSDNELNEIPATLGECTKLTELYLHGNPDIGIPREILGPTWVTVHFLHQGPPANPAEILNYYFRPKRPLLESKLILVGRGEVGKTSLINRLIHNTFGKEQQTDGIKITRAGAGAQRIRTPNTG